MHMTTGKEIYASYLHRAKIPGADIFLVAQDALSFTEHCDRIGLAIIGVEGVRIDAGGTTPYMDAISDASPTCAMEWEEFKEDRNGFARECLRLFISEKGPDTYFCFVYLDAEGYAKIMNRF